MGSRKTASGRECIQQFFKTSKVRFFLEKTSEHHLLFGLDYSMKKQKYIHPKRGGYCASNTGLKSFIAFCFVF